TIGRPELLSNWLYGVAHRVARRARKTMARRREEQRGVDMVAARGSDDVAERDLRAFLQEEVQRLPAKDRSPPGLCHPDGHTNAEAARRLGWPVGTVKVRLLRGREMLRKRLVRRGCVLSLAVALSPGPAEAVPPHLAEATLRTALALGTGSVAGGSNARAVE